MQKAIKGQEEIIEPPPPKHLASSENDMKRWGKGGEEARHKGKRGRGDAGLHFFFKTAFLNGAKN